MIKEISINFNEQKVELNAYKNYVGDGSIESRLYIVTNYPDDMPVTMDEQIDNAIGLIKDYNKDIQNDNNNNN